MVDARFLRLLTTVDSTLTFMNQYYYLILIDVKILVAKKLPEFFAGIVCVRRTTCSLK